jgi:hypothetical protein
MKSDELKNNYTYHAPRSDSEVNLYKSIRLYGFELANYINENCPDSREKSLALTKLEEAVMWANASIARNNKPITKEGE